MYVLDNNKKIAGGSTNICKAIPCILFWVGDKEIITTFREVSRRF
jgi:hypothetical protein